MAKHLSCDLVTGRLTWLHRPRAWFKSDRDFKKWNTRYSGADALTSIHSKGYRRGSVMGQMVYAHRLVYILAHGPIPDGMMVDHINGNRLDNRPCNLRLATHLQNCQNRNSEVISGSGIRGVHLVKRDGTYQARIRVMGKNITMSGFVDASDAAIARKKMEMQHWKV